MKFAPEHRCQCALEDAAILLVKRVQIGLRLLHFFPWMGVVDGRLTKLVETAIQVCSHDQRLALKLRNIIPCSAFKGDTMRIRRPAAKRPSNKSPVKGRLSSESFLKTVP